MTTHSPRAAGTSPPSGHSDLWVIYIPLTVLFNKQLALIWFDKSSFDAQKIGKYGDHTLSFSILIAESIFGNVSTLMELNGAVIAWWCQGESIPDYVQE